MTHLRLVGGPNWPDDIGTALDFIETAQRVPILPPRLYLTERQAEALRAAGWPAVGELPEGVHIVTPTPGWSEERDADLEALSAELMAREAAWWASDCMDFLRAGPILRRSE